MVGPPVGHTLPPLACHPACPHLPLGMLTRVQTTQHSLLPQTTSVFAQLCPQRESQATRFSPEADPPPTAHSSSAPSTHGTEHPVCRTVEPLLPRCLHETPAQALSAGCTPLPLPPVWHIVCGLPRARELRRGSVSLHLDVLPRSNRDNHVAGPIFIQQIAVIFPKEESL